MNVINNLIDMNDQTCVSIVIPTDPVDKRKNYETLKKAIQKSKTLLEVQKARNEVKSDLIRKLDSLSVQVPKTLSDGLGIFISQDHLAVIRFPFAVKDKIKVDKAFEIRDLLYLKQYGSPYYIVNLSRKAVHLYKGKLSELEEIRNGFPVQYRDDFEYERASIADSSASSLKGFEKGKNEITEIRLKAVFREADALLTSHLAHDGLLLLAGTQRMISLFNAVTDHKKRIIGKISGSFNEKSVARLRESGWQAFLRFRKDEIAKAIQNLNEKNNGHVAEGLQNAWVAANEGKGLTLVVERDFHHRAYRKQAQSALHLQPPKKPYKVVRDAVDELIQVVESRKGRVLLTENDQLKDHSHVALVLRY